MAELRANDAEAFAPFTVDDWLASPWTEYESCIGWPAPDPWVPPVDSPATYPAVPTLVLVGDLDSITSSEGSRIVADRFPNSTFVQVANTGHVTALVDYSRCASNIVIEFVRTDVSGRHELCVAVPGGAHDRRVPAAPRRHRRATRIGLGRQRRVASAVTVDGRRRVPALVRDARV